MSEILYFYNYSLQLYKILFLNNAMNAILRKLRNGIEWSELKLTNWDNRLFLVMSL